MHPNASQNHGQRRSQKKDLPEVTLACDDRQRLDEHKPKTKLNKNG